MAIYHFNCFSRCFTYPLAQRLTAVTYRSPSNSMGKPKYGPHYQEASLLWMETCWEPLGYAKHSLLKSNLKANGCSHAHHKLWYCALLCFSRLWISTMVLLGTTSTAWQIQCLVIKRCTALWGEPIKTSTWWGQCYHWAADAHTSFQLHWPRNG